MGSKSDPSSDGLPSYSESVRSQQHSSPRYLPQNIAAARTAVISSLLTTYITPHLHERALSGLSSTTLVLVPSNVSSLQPPGKIESKGPPDSENGLPLGTVVGFPSAESENLKMVRLHGQDNSLEFWRQLVVMQELGQQIRSHLRNSGHQVIGDNETSLQEPSSLNADWRTVQKETLGDGQVRIRVEITEICLRIENDMGCKALFGVTSSCSRLLSESRDMLQEQNKRDTPCYSSFHLQVGMLTPKCASVRDEDGQGCRC